MNIATASCAYAIAMCMAFQFICFNNIAIKKETEHQLPKQKPSKMTSNDFTTSFLVEQTPEEVFDAVNNVRGWWSESVEGKTAGLNEEFLYYYKDVHISKMRIVEFVPGKRVTWLVLDNHFNFIKDTTEWVGTKIVFDISPDENQTRLRFTHQGLVPTYECYEVCNDAWTSYIQGSLKSLITTGRGKPNPKEGGLNAELIEKWKLPQK